MALDATRPSDVDFISLLAQYIRETREAVNTIEAAETADLLPAVTTVANADTSPSVLGAFALKTANTGATLISFFDNGYEGQIITLTAGDSHTTIQHDAGLINLTSRVNILLSSGETICLVYINGVWSEVGGYKRYTMTDITAVHQHIGAFDRAIRANSGVGSQTLVLPPADTVSIGHEVRVKKVDPSSNTVSISGDGTDTINTLSAAVELTLQNESITLISDGVSDWTTF